MTKKTVVMLAIFPVILIFIGCVFLQQISPVYAGAFGYDQDPAYQYLLNGLTILDGHSPSHIDHPGTPLQILIAFITLVEWLMLRMVGLGSESVISSVLAQPEFYIQSISWALLILNAWAVFCFGGRIFQSTNSIKLAIFSQSSPLAFWVVAPRIVYLAPEALLISASLFLLGLLAPVLLSENENENCRSAKIALLAGIVCGFGIAVKITFIPMLGLLLLLGGRSNVIRAFKYAAITWAICISPVIGRIPQMWNWVYSLALHSEKYGRGEKTFFDADAMPGRLVNLFEAYPFFYLVALALTLALIVNVVLKAIFNATRSSSNKSSRKSIIDFQAVIKKWNMKVPLVLLIVGGLQTLLLLKHFGVHYMTPVLPLSFVGAVWLVQQRCVIISPLNQWAPNILLGLACVMAINSTSAAYNHLWDSRQIQDKSLADIQAELSKYSNPLVIGSYRCTLPECALSFGSGYAPHLDSKVSPLLPNFISFNIWNKRLYVYGEGFVGLNRINNYLSEGREVFLVSPRYPELSAFNLKLITDTPIQSLYKVTGISGSGS